MSPSPSPPPTPAPPAVVPDPAPDPATTTLSPPTSPTRPETRPHQQHRRLSSTYLASLVSPTKEEFDHIAEIQSQREADLRRRSREMRRLSDTPTASTHNSEEVAHGDHHHHHHSSSRGSRFLDRLGLGHLRRISGTSEEAKAATVIQRNYRGYRARREMHGMGLDASTRWVHAVREAQWRAMTQPRGRNEDAGEEDQVVVSPGRRQWRKVATIARRAGEDASSGGSSSTEEDEDGKRREEARERRRKKARMMGLQYFLEMVDLKHRYGANLRVYHEEWKRAETNENFFYWLDHGEGRTLDIEACPRERLEREQVRYLSREERQYYLVTVDEEGRLCWAKNGARIDTTEKWKDSVHGIVPADDTSTPEFRPPAGDTGTRLLGDSSTDSDSSSSSSSSSDSSIDSETAAEAAHYATPSLDTAKGVKKIKHVTVATLFDKLLRKSVRRNTWIFVVDTSFRLYVGIKNSGAFQHSSFLQGSRISAAGLIKIRDGKLTRLSPLSGHYRPPASNFRAFLKSLREEGVDMKHVTISKSYAVLVGLETYVKIHKKGKEVIERLKRAKERVVAPEEFKKHEEERRDKSESAAREEQVVRQEEQMREENQVTVKALQKLGLEPSEPKGQRGAEEANAEGPSV